MCKNQIKRFLIVSLIISSVNAPSAQDKYQIGNRINDIELIPVAIQGATVNAGTYYVPPALRVYDVITRASPGNIPDLRTIDCRSVNVNSENSIIKLDLLKFLSGGDLSQNPFVKAGMTIKLGYAVKYVTIQGELKGSITGKVPIASQETAGSLLSLFTFTNLADSTNIVLFRDGEGTKKFTLSQISTLVLKDGDFISVLPRKDVPRQASVIVSGEAITPGMYPVIHGKTTLSEILAMSGGASPKGDLSRAYLIRRAKVQKKTSDAFLAGQNNVRPEVTGGFKYLTASKDFSIIPAEDGSVCLEDGDEIVIPTKELCVYVSGCVKKPGAYPYESGHPASYYIKLAGGYTRSADKPNVKIVTSFTDDAFSISMPRHLSAGDIIIVPEAQEDKWVKRWSPIITAATTVISGIGIIVTLSKK